MVNETSTVTVTDPSTLVSPSPTKKEIPLSAIVGGAGGGVALIIGIVAASVLLRRKKQSVNVEVKLDYPAPEPSQIAFKEEPLSIEEP